jgi:hypothetical protein
MTQTYDGPSSLNITSGDTNINGVDFAVNVLKSSLLKV